MSKFSAPRPGNPNALAASDCCIPQPGNDGISCLKWSPTANILVSGNWDGGVRFWLVREQRGHIQAMHATQVNHLDNTAVLDVCFSPDGQKIFSGGCDKAVRMYELGQAPPNNVATQIGTHDQPIKGVGYIRSSNLVVSGGWDCKLKFWDQRQPQPVGVFDLPERVYDLDVQDNLLVVATAGRHIIAYDCSGQAREHSRCESQMKHQTRCISCFPDATGFAVGSIEGRVGMHYLQKVAGKENFAFKCHRRDSAVYAINGIAFHPKRGVFATVGSDGGVNFWDAENRLRLKGFNTTQRAMSCAAFNAQGNLFAYASSYDWSKGSGDVQAQSGNEIFIHHVQNDEIHPKDKLVAGYGR